MEMVTVNFDTYFYVAFKVEMEFLWLSLIVNFTPSWRGFYKLEMQ